MIYRIYDYDFSFNDDPANELKNKVTSSQVFLKNLLNSLIANHTFAFVLIPNNNFSTFFRKLHSNALYTNTQQLIENIDYFIRLILKKNAIIAAHSELNQFIELINENNWNASDNNTADFYQDINTMFDQTVLDIIFSMSSNSFLFINHDADPMYLMFRSQK